MKKLLSAALLAASALMSANVAHATAFDRYSSHTDFVSEVNGLNTYTFGPISGTQTNLGKTLTVGSVTFSSDSDLFLEKDGEFTSLVSKGSSVTITPTGGTALGFFLTSANTEDGINLNFNGFGDRTFGLYYSGDMAFFGLDAFMNVDSVTLSNYNGELHLFDVETNGTYVPQTQVAATPEPSSLALLSTGVLGVGGMVRRRFTRS